MSRTQGILYCDEEIPKDVILPRILRRNRKRKHESLYTADMSYELGKNISLCDIYECCPSQEMVEYIYVTYNPLFETLFPLHGVFPVDYPLVSSDILPR